MSPLARFTLIRTRVNHRDPGLVFLISTLSLPVRLTRECNSTPDHCELNLQRASLLEKTRFRSNNVTFPMWKSTIAGTHNLKINVARVERRRDLAERLS